MKSTIRKSTVVAFASAAILASQAFAQTNIPTDEDSVVRGSLGITAPRVVGSNAATATLQSPVTFSATVQQPTDVSFNSVTRKGVTTTTLKTGFDSYAFGNKEIIALTVTNPSGASLLYTAPFTNASAVNLVVARSNSSTTVTNTVLDVNEGSSVFTVQQTETNGVPTVEKGTGVQAFDIEILGALTAAGTGDVTFDDLAKATFGSGTNRTTETYPTATFRGNFSGVNTTD